MTNIAGHLYSRDIKRGPSGHCLSPSQLEVGGLGWVSSWTSVPYGPPSCSCRSVTDHCRPTSRSGREDGYRRETRLLLARPANAVPWAKTAQAGART